MFASVQRPAIHDLKCDPVPFSLVRTGQKAFEVREDDRGYEVGDVLVLREHVRAGVGGYTGATIIARVTCITRGYGLPENMCVLGIELAQFASGGRVLQGMPTSFGSDDKEPETVSPNARTMLSAGRRA